MLDIGTAEFNLAVPSLPEQELRDRSSELFDCWEQFVGTAIALPDYSLFLQVEEGSVNGRARIGAVAAALYFGIGNYGGFVSGVKTIGEQVSATSDFLTDQAKRVFSCSDDRAVSRKRGGAVASLQRLFVRVQRGELTPEEATARAESLLGEEAATVPGLIDALGDAFNSCPSFHEQQELPFPDASDEFIQREVPAPTGPRPTRPLPPLAPSLQLRVEVWRDSKKQGKQTRIIRL